MHPRQYGPMKHLLPTEAWAWLQDQTAHRAADRQSRHNGVSIDRLEEFFLHILVDRAFLGDKETRPHLYA